MELEAEGTRAGPTFSCLVPNNKTLLVDIFAILESNVFLQPDESMYFFSQLKLYYYSDGPGKVRDVGRPLIRVIEGKIRSQVEVILSSHS